jgi:outer membrane protein assembly factor BamE (lipoprotein component of BamABCDE complex)
MYRLIRLGVIMGLLAWLSAACDQIRTVLDPYARLQPGQLASDVVRQIGQPVFKYPETNGEQRWEYTLGPEGHQNYFVWFDINLKLARVEALLTPETFAKVQLGMNREAVRRLLGPAFYEREYFKPGKTLEWRYLQANSTETALFFVVFDVNGLVTETGSRRDPRYDAG